MSAKKLELGAIEKIVEPKWLVKAFALLFFADAYLLLRHDLNLIAAFGRWGHISVKGWEGLDLDIGELLLGVIAFALTLKVILPILEYQVIVAWSYVDSWINTLFDLTPKSPPRLDPRYFTHVDTLRRRAVDSNNAIAYREVERHEKKCQEMDLMRQMSQTILLFGVIGYAASTSVSPSLFRLAELHIQALSWYAQILPAVLLFLFTLGIFHMSLSRDSTRDYIFLPSRGQVATVATPAHSVQLKEPTSEGDGST